MVSERCNLCDRRACEGTHLCRACLVEAYPPVSAVSLHAQPDAVTSKQNSRVSVLNAVSVVLGMIVMVLFVVAVVVG